MSLHATYGSGRMIFDQLNGIEPGAGDPVDIHFKSHERGIGFFGKNVEAGFTFTPVFELEIVIVVGEFHTGALGFFGCAVEFGREFL